MQGDVMIDSAFRINPLPIAAAALIIFSAVAPARTVGQGEEKAPDIKLPATAASADAFVPRGWRVEAESDDRLTGDLNGDGRMDRVLRLVQDGPAESADGVARTRFRALAVLFGRPEGGFALATVTTKLLLCSTCAGMRGDPASGSNIQIRIERGVIIIEQQSGSRFAYDQRLRFRLDPEAKRFLLIGEDKDDRDTATGERTEESNNYLTGVRLTRKYRYNERQDDEKLVSTKTTRIPRQRKFIEDVDSNQI